VFVGDPAQRIDGISLTSPHEQQVLEQSEACSAIHKIGPMTVSSMPAAISILALRLLASSRTYRVDDIPPAALFELPPPRRLRLFFAMPARSADIEDLGPRVVAIRSGTSNSHCFWFLAVRRKAEMMLYSRMFSHFVSDQRVYGLRADREVEIEKRRLSIEHRAAGCIAEIRRLQPRGPILWLGNVSGCVAF
jgi:hypothetical protein